MKRLSQHIYIIALLIIIFVLLSSNTSYCRKSHDIVVRGEIGLASIPGELEFSYSDSGACTYSWLILFTIFLDYNDSLAYHLGIMYFEQPDMPEKPTGHFMQYCLPYFGIADNEPDSYQKTIVASDNLEKIDTILSIVRGASRVDSPEYTITDSSIILETPIYGLSNAAIDSIIVHGYSSASLGEMKIFDITNKNGFQTTIPDSTKDLHCIRVLPNEVNVLDTTNCPYIPSLDITFVKLDIIN